MSNGRIILHSVNTETIGEVLVALLPKYEVYVSMEGRHVEIQYCDSEKEKGADSNENSSR